MKDEDARRQIDEIRRTLRNIIGIPYAEDAAAFRTITVDERLKKLNHRLEDELGSRAARVFGVYSPPVIDRIVRLEKNLAALMEHLGVETLDMPAATRVVKKREKK